MVVIEFKYRGNYKTCMKTYRFGFHMSNELNST